jgi:hypothetical protein
LVLGDERQHHAEVGQRQFQQSRPLGDRRGGQLAQQDVFRRGQRQDYRVGVLVDGRGGTVRADALQVPQDRPQLVLRVRTQPVTDGLTPSSAMLRVAGHDRSGTDSAP